jgi:hypothetical protein
LFHGQGTSVKKVLLCGEEEVGIDDNVTLYAAKPKRLAYLPTRDGALPADLIDPEEDLDEINEKQIAVLYDKGSNRIFLLHYYIGCKGQWDGTEGKTARVFVEALNEWNPYLKSRSLRNNRRLPAASVSTVSTTVSVAPASATSVRRSSRNRCGLLAASVSTVSTTVSTTVLVAPALATSVPQVEPAPASTVLPTVLVAPALATSVPQVAPPPASTVLHKNMMYRGIKMDVVSNLEHLD